MKKQNDNLVFYGKWIRMTGKRQFKKTSFYLLLIGVLFLLYLVQNTILPGVKNTRVGIFAENGICAEKAKEVLLQQEGGLTFVEASGEEELKDAVYRGEYDCGFLLPQSLDEAMTDRDLRDSVTYIYSTVTTKGMVAKESVYAVLFRFLSSELLKTESENGTLFEESSTGAAEAVLAANERYLGGDEIFTVNFVDAGDADPAESVDAAGKESGVDTAAGVLGSCVFAAALCCGRYRFGTEYETIGRKLPGRTREMIRFLQILIPLFWLSVPLTIVFAVMQNKSVLSLIPSMALLVILSALWAFFFSFCFHSEQKYLCGILGVLIVSVLVTPVFFDLSVYVPAVGVVRRVFPAYYFGG